MHEEAIQFAKKYVEDLLSFFGLNTDVQAHLNDDEIIEIQVPSTHMNGFLIGQHGDVLHALQFVTISAMMSHNLSIQRLNLDVAEYKKQRADHLAQQAEGWVKDVVRSGQDRDLHPMNAADRRIVHHVASEAGLRSESVGEGRDRHIVLRPADTVVTAVEPTDETEPVTEA